MKRLNSILFISICFVATLKAQPGGNIGQFEINVTDKYKASVGEAVKYTDIPSFEDTAVAKLPVNYKITSQPVEVRFKPEPLQPARIAKIPVEQLYRGMIKAGFGLYGTPLLEGYFNSGRSSTHSYGFWAEHFSTSRGVRDILYDDNGLSTNELGGYFNRFYRDMKWQTRIFGRFDKYSYYGLNEIPEVTGDSSRGEPLENWYRQFGVKSGITQNKAEDLGMLDQLWLEYYLLSDDFNNRENYVDLSSDWTIPVENIDLQLEANLNYYRTVFDLQPYGGQSYFTFQIRPHISTVIKDIVFDFGLNINSNTGSLIDSSLTDTRLYFYPEIKVSYPFVRDVLTAYAGVKGQLQQNTLRHLSDENPFINPRGIFLQPTSTNDVFIGLKGIITSTTSFNVKGGFKSVEDWAIYFRDPFYYSDSAAPGLAVVYDDADIFYVKGELSANVNNRLKIHLDGELRSINTNRLSRAWHVPLFTAGLYLDYTWKRKIRLSPDLTYVGPRKAFDAELNPLVDDDLPAYLRADLKVEYLYNNRISAFVNMYNLFNTPYDIYLGYQAQNINFLMGFAYKF